MNREQITQRVETLVNSAIKTGKDKAWALAWSVYQTPVGQEPSEGSGKTEGPWRIPFLAWRRAEEMRHGAVEAAARTLSRLTPGTKGCSARPQNGGIVAKKERKARKKKDPEGKSKGSTRKCGNCRETGHTKRKCPSLNAAPPLVSDLPDDYFEAKTVPKAKAKKTQQRAPRAARRAPEKKVKRRPCACGKLSLPVDEAAEAPAGDWFCSMDCLPAVVQPDPAKKTPKARPRRAKKKKGPPTDDEHIERIDGLLSLAMQSYEESLPEDHHADDEVFATAVVEWAIATAIQTELGEDRGALLQLVVRSLNDLVEDAYDEDGDEEEDGDDDQDDGDDDYSALPQAILDRINGFDALRN